MEHLLQTDENQTIIQCSVHKNDTITAINANNYASLLIEMCKQRKTGYERFVSATYELYGIKDLWLDREKNSGVWKTINEFVEDKFKEVAKNYGLKYVTN